MTICKPIYFEYTFYSKLYSILLSDSFDLLIDKDF